MERDTPLQGMFTYLLISKALRKECPSMFPKSGSLCKQTPIPEPYLTYLTGYPVKEPSLQVPLTHWRTQWGCLGGSNSPEIPKF
jgi:hypothetical protein